MDKLIKQNLRTLFKMKRQQLVASRAIELPVKLQKQLMRCVSIIQKTMNNRISLVGSYIPNKKVEIPPPNIDKLQYSYPWFQKKKKGQKPPLLEFKIVQDQQKQFQRVYGIQIPKKQLTTVYPQLVLVPLTCFSPSSRQRIGYGGGFYDSYIAQRRKQGKLSYFIGIGAQPLKTNQHFWSDHDQPLDYIITQQTIY